MALSSVGFSLRGFDFRNDRKARRLKPTLQIHVFPYTGIAAP